MRLITLIVISLSLLLISCSKEEKTIEIIVDLNNGKHKQTMYFCDLSHDYVRINSEYTT